MLGLRSRSRSSSSWLAVAGGRVAALPALLGVDQVLQLAPVQEDAAAVGALVDADAAALVGAHEALALGADEVGCHWDRLLAGRGSSLGRAGDHREPGGGPEQAGARGEHQELGPLDVAQPLQPGRAPAGRLDQLDHPVGVGPTRPAAAPPARTGRSGRGGGRAPRAASAAAPWPARAAARPGRPRPTAPRTAPAARRAPPPARRRGRHPGRAASTAGAARSRRRTARPAAPRRPPRPSRPPGRRGRPAPAGAPASRRTGRGR